MPQRPRGVKSFHGMIQTESEDLIQLSHIPSVNMYTYIKESDTDKNFGSSRNSKVHLELEKDFSRDAKEDGRW